MDTASSHYGDKTTPHSSRDFRRLSLSRSARPSAYNARNVRVLIASSKKVFSQDTTRSLLERCPHKKNEALAAQRCYLRRNMCATRQCNTLMRLFLAS